MEKEKKKRLYKDKRLLFWFLKALVKPVAFFKWGYRRKSKYKIAKDEKVVVVSNHQTDYDPILIHLSFNHLLRTLATDNIFSGLKSSKYLDKLGVIPKKKGMVDLKSNIAMFNSAQAGESLLFFPEGNRSYADFKYYISDKIGKLIKSLGATLIIFNLHGGFGKYPRWGKKKLKRKGRFYGYIKEIYKYDEYKDMTDQEVSDIVINGIRKLDCESGDTYKCKARAEYLERMYFVCPKCGAVHKLRSEGNYLYCDACGLKVEYTEDLHLTSDAPEFKFTTLFEWYEYQKKWVIAQKFEEGQTIFEDDNVTLHTANPFKERRFISEGKMRLTTDELAIGDAAYKLKDLMIASPVSGRKLVFTIGEDSFTARGPERFNALKYVFMFNKLDTKMRNEHIDQYFTLEELEK